MPPASVSTPLRFVLLLALAAAAPALAHGTGPEVRSIAVRPGAAQDLFVNGTFGMMVSRDGGASWGWVCQQALGTGGFVPRGALWTGSGRLLAVTGPSLLVSPDGGCSWERHAELEQPERGALDVALSAAEPETVYVLSADGVRRSTDGARAFSRFLGVAPGLSLTSLEVAPAAPAHVYAAGLAEGAPALWRSRDGAQSGELLKPTFGALEGVSDLQLLAVSPADPLLLYARASRGPEELLLRSTDGGQSFRVALSPGELIEGLELSRDGGTLWLGSYAHLYRSTDAGLTFELLREPTVNACARHDGSRLLACGSEPDHGWSLGVSTDAGERWTPLFTLAQLQEVASCPASSPTAQVCGPLLPGLVNALGPPGSAPPLPAAPEEGEEGGCAAGGGSALPGLALALLVLGTARRRGVRARRRAG